MKPILLTAVATMTTATMMLTATGCSKLSSEAREIVGCYYIPEVSEDVSLMELNDDATCVMRAVKPGVLTYEVPGRWNVERDSLICELNPEMLTFEGDSTLIGDVASHIAKHIVGFNGITLTLEKEGIQYIYHRRAE